MSCEDTGATAQDGSSITIKGNAPLVCREINYRYTGPALPMDAKAGEGDDSYGVLVGSGSDAEAITGYALASKIGEADMHHYAVEGGEIESLTDKWSLRIIRDFVNVSGVDKTVAELGLATWQRYYMKDYTAVTYDVNNKALVFRRVISPVTVTPNQVLRVTIIISIPK